MGLDVVQWVDYLLRSSPDFSRDLDLQKKANSADSAASGDRDRVFEWQRRACACCAVAFSSVRRRGRIHPAKSSWQKRGDN